MSDTKVVQTALSDDEYERFRAVVEDEDLTVKEGVRRAIREYADSHMRYDPDDPIFNVEPHEGGESFDAAETDELLADAVESEDDAPEPDAEAPDR